MATDWDGFADAVAENLLTAGLPSEALTSALARLLVGQIRDRDEQADEDALTSGEASALLGNPGMVTAAGYAMDLWEAQHDATVARAFLRSELAYGPSATRKYGPYLPGIPGPGGEPVGVEGAERLVLLTRQIEARCRRDGLECQRVLSTPGPYLTIVDDGPVVVFTGRYEKLLPLIETGADDERIAEAFAACDFNLRRTIAVLRDGVPPVISDGAL